jgi:hypothetical protein
MLLAAIWPAASPAQGQQINIFSFEDASCNAWVKSSSNKMLRAQYEFWIRGFISGHNYASPSRQVEIGSFPGSEALYKYLDQYCHDNPSSSFIGGAIALVDQLRVKVSPTAPQKKEAVKPPAGKASSGSQK